MKNLQENSIFRMLSNTGKSFPDYFPLQNQTLGFHFSYENSFSPAFILHLEFDLHRAKRNLSFKISKLDELGNWTCVNSPGDLVLFLGINCTFFCQWCLSSPWLQEGLYSFYQANFGITICDWSIICLRSKSQVLIFTKTSFQIFFSLYFVFYVLRGKRYKRVAKIQIYPCF